MYFTLCFCIFLSALCSRNHRIVLSIQSLYNPPLIHSHHFYHWRWRQCVPPKHKDIFATTAWHRNWEKKIQTGGMFWWKEMLQLTPSLKKALIWQHLTCVVFPDPVSPLMSNTWLLLIECIISSLIDQIGRACLNGSNSRFIAAYGTCGIPLFKRPIHLFSSFTEKSKLN